MYLRTEEMCMPAVLMCICCNCLFIYVFDCFVQSVCIWKLRVCCYNNHCSSRPVMTM